MSRGNNSEMNRVPEDDEPILRYNSEFRDVPSGDRKNHGLPKCCFKCCGVCLVVFLILCGSVAIALGVSYKHIESGVKQFAASKVPLVNNSVTVKQWASPPTPVHFTLNMFNLTNKDEFMNGGKPKFEQVGPFVYSENKTKFDLVWNDDESILRYNESCVYTLNTNSNTLDPSVKITTLNLPLMGLLVQFEKLQSLVKEIKNDLLRVLVDDIIKGFDEALRTEFKENLLITRSVDEIVWGYSDPFLKFVADLDLPVPGIPKDGFFSLEEKSGYTGPNMIYTGKKNHEDTARFIMWNGFLNMDGWGTPYAQMINGTEAIIFHPGVKRSDNLTLFVSELFRSGYFSYYQDVEEYGVKMYQFRLPPDLLSGKDSDEGFNMDGPDGVLNLTAVYPLNVPVFVSKPHFLDADKRYRHYIDGMSPVRDKHDAYLNVEPITGAVLNAAKRLQINIELKQNANIEELSKLQNITYFPLLWVEEGGKMNSSQAEDFKKQVYVPMHAVDGASLGLAAGTGFVAVLSCLLLFVLATYYCEKKIKSSRRRREPISVRFDD